MPRPTSPTPEQVAYMEQHASDNIVPGIIACATMCPILATTFICLRLWSRQINQGRFKLDASDYLSIAAWILYIPFNIVIGLNTRFGAGRHIIFVTDRRAFEILVVVLGNLYAVVLTLLKLSILSLYRKLFGNTRWLYILTWVVTAFVAELALQVILATSLQCIPITATWDMTVDATCINFGAVALAAYIINISTDITILLMPIPVVRKLQTSRSKKQGLMAVFAAGGSACIVSFIQLHFITKVGSTADRSWDMMPPTLVADVEIMVGFLATSIATYRPLYRRVFKGIAPSSSRNYKPLHSDDSRRINRLKRILAGGRQSEDNTSTENSRDIVDIDQIELTGTRQLGEIFDSTTGGRTGQPSPV